MSYPAPLENTQVLLECLLSIKLLDSPLNLMVPFSKVTIIGVGLIGGSIGLAIRQRGLAEQVVGVGRSESSLSKAQSVGAITQATINLPEGVKDAELVIVATPVSRVVEDVSAVLSASSAKTLITDVGSTKSYICHEVEQLGVPSSRFVGSHPLAGDHRSGAEFGRGDLFIDKTVVLTPTSGTAETTISGLLDFWDSLGAKAVQMTPEEHDEALAFTSHLPHLVASVLAGSTPPDWLSFSGSGWADSTRIAASDPELWTQIFTQNREGVLSALRQMLSNLQLMHDHLVEEDWAKLQEYLAQAKRTRDALGN